MNRSWGPPLGIDATTIYDQFTVSLDPGDLVFLYTDGVSEAMNREDELYSPQRLAQVVLHGGQEPQDAIRSVLDDVLAFRAGRGLSDDVCLVDFRRRS